MARIAVGGWQHETNTFATYKADYTAFERADEWPPLCAGQSLFDHVDGVHLPITGAIEELKCEGHDLVPLLWCSATPCSYVTRHAFETISNQFLNFLQEAMPLDGIYFDLHGAMVCEHFEDGEGEFLRRVRAQVGDDIPIAVSLDLHGNVTPLMVQHATVLDVFRTYPHIDMGETGARVAQALSRVLRTGHKPYAAYRQVDFMIPLNAGCSLIEPCNTIYRELPEVLGSDVFSASFACGFHLSDIRDVGPSVVAYGDSLEAVNQAAEQLLHSVQSREKVFYEKIWATDEGVARALSLVEGGAKTVVIADTQDNPGGGGSGDTTGILQALIAQGARDAVFGALSDPDTVAQAKATGIGGGFTASLGGKSGLPGQEPYICECKVLRLNDGYFTATGPMYFGANMSVGDCALLEIAGVEVVVTSSPVQTADQAIFRHLGIEPAAKKVVALKSSVHFRNDFTELATDILVVAAPGAVFADPSVLNYKRKRSNIRIL